MLSLTSFSSLAGTYVKWHELRSCTLPVGMGLQPVTCHWGGQIPGDGRELVATDSAAVTIRAEDGRRVEGVDISPFISNLPAGRPTACFRSDDASGSTSQAANIQEVTS